jgi:hypothetical protein
MTVRLEDLQPDAQVRGLMGREAVRIVSAEMLGEAACMVVYRGQDGVLGEQLLFRSNEADLELVGGGGGDPRRRGPRSEAPDRARLHERP